MYRLWPLSHNQIKDGNGNILIGAKAYFYQSDATTPITVFQDYDLTTPHAWPVVANGIGIFPAVFLNEAGSFYRHIVKTSGDITISGYDQGKLPIAGPPVVTTVVVSPDANALLKTGYVIWQPNSGTLTSFVRMNGRTIGDATSGAAERANADSENLFLYAWNNFNDTVCPVTSGRGANAAADWAAHKKIATIDMRGRGPWGLDDMGSAAASRLTGATFDGAFTATTQAGTGGTPTSALAQANLPNLTLTATIAAGQGSHGHPGSTVAVQAGIQPTAGAAVQQAQLGGSTALTIAANTLPAMTGTVPTGGSASAFNNMPPFTLGTFYWKL